MRYYTRKGDNGFTSVDGCVLKKDEPVVRALGDVDELNSAVGVAAANITDAHLEEMLRGVQNTLFVIGAQINSLGKDAGKSKTMAERTKDLEAAIEELGATLPALNKFVLPSGSAGASCLHLARAICRRAERSVTALAFTETAMIGYMNRLSSFLFVAALYVNKKGGVEETNPAYTEL